MGKGTDCKFKVVAYLITIVPKNRVAFIEVGKDITNLYRIFVTDCKTMGSRHSFMP